MTEKEYLESYNPDVYEKPSVTADILVFTLNKDCELELLLIKRGRHPYKGKWAIPGGFVGMKESVDEAAKRELAEETGVNQGYLEQLYTFGAVDRDPRMRVISVAYLALIPRKTLDFHAGDDAQEAKLFKVNMENWELTLKSEDGTRIFSEDLAFDHGEIILMGLKRLSGKLDYTDIAFELLQDKECFTIRELKLIYDAIKGVKSDTGNFRRMFKSRYVDEGKAVDLNKSSGELSFRKAKCYRYIG